MPHTTPPLAHAALTVQLDAPGLTGSGPGRIQLFPLGSFSARDGRPGTMSGVSATAWRLTTEDAAALVTRWQQRATPVVVDYEHQTMLSGENGQPAPASGWITALSLEADGLYADVEWTQRARDYIRAREYRYISPTFSFDRKTGAVLELKSAALTNFPALDGMAAAQAKHTITQGTTMPFFEDVKKLLALPTETDEAVALESITALTTTLAEKTGEIVALKAAAKGAPDPSHYAPVALLTATQGQLALVTAELTALKGKLALAGLEGDIEAALKDGRLHAQGKEWALALAASNPEALRTYLATAPPLAALGGQQTDAQPPPESTVSLTEEEAYICAQLGTKPENFLKSKKECA